MASATIRAEGLRCWLPLVALGLTASCGAGELAPEPSDQPPVPPFTVLGRWEDPTQLSYQLDSQGGALRDEVFRSTIERALGTWSATGLVGFQPAQAGSTPEVHFRWGESASEEHPDGLFGRDTSVAKTGPVGPGCTVWFDPDQAWREGGGDGPRLFQSAVHEIGHVLGLGHSTDLASVMYTQLENGRTELAASDLHGLQSLYGGGEPGPGDLLIEGEGSRVLRRVAPSGSTDWSLFDSDGDGDQELLVWSSGGSREGALTVYHFGPGPELQRSVGPILGIAGFGAQLECVEAGGERYLDVFQVDGSASRLRWDRLGFPRDAQPIPVRKPRAEPSEMRRGDLDGDGRLEGIRLLDAGTR